ncbi:MAG: sulfite exporter TauE/SafE family protein [Planctomycetes bacterium]|nr:sulfite exporter TauE/SafE family protein [Planctomycetota bacterium]
MPDLTPLQWLLAVVAAMGIGFSKSGFAGVGLFHVIVFAMLLGARESTGALLPMLVIGDISAVFFFRQHARWDYIRRLLLPAAIGILVGWWLMGRLDDRMFKPLIGGIVLSLAVLQLARMWRGDWFEHIPHARWFAWTIGLLAGLSTMLANAAGPIVAIYLLAVSLPKYEFVGTTAWFFLIVNLSKLPISASLGLIHPDTLAMDAALAPAIVLGMVIGRWLVHRINQRWFDTLLLVFALVAGLRLMGII